MCNKKNIMPHRWGIAITGVFIMTLLGTITAWSVFINPIMTSTGWCRDEVAVVFMILIGSLGISTALGGALLDIKGPKFVATLGAILYGVGTLLAGFAIVKGSIWMLYIGYGLIGGIGNGLAYPVSIATLIRWFPDKQSLMGGLSVMGFGFGAFFIGLIVPGLINCIGVANVFTLLGSVYLLSLTLASIWMKNPPEGYIQEFFTPLETSVSDYDSLTFSDARKTHQWYMIWTMLFINVSAGMGLFSRLSPMAQELIMQSQGITDPGKLAVYGGAVLATAALFNGLGRLFWAALSDGIGRKNVLLTMFVTQAALHIYLPHITDLKTFTVIVCYLISCLGGGFAIMPALTAACYGPVHIGKIYGFVLTAWGVAGIIGSLIFSKLDKQQALYCTALLMLAGFVVTLLFHKPKRINGYTNRSLKNP